MDTSKKVPIQILSFFYDVRMGRITVIAHEQNAERPETVLLNLKDLPETDRRGFLGAVRSILPQSVRELAIWEPVPTPLIPGSEKEEKDL